MTNINKRAAKLAEEHAHKCFPYNATGDSAKHEVLLQNQHDSFVAGYLAGYADADYNYKECAKTLNAVSAGRSVIEKQNELMREALEFYANGFDKKLTNSMMGVNTPALGDGGHIARKTLEQTKDE